MKISVIGAGNVGSLAAMRLAQEGLGEIVLVDIVKGLAQGKALDLDDARPILKQNYNLTGSHDINSIKGSDIVVITAGLTRKPGMTREELLNKNSLIVKDLCQNVKKLAADCILIIVTNPLDLMTYLALKTTGFAQNKVLGMGISLDTARLVNLISEELNIPNTDIEAQVIGTHGEGMLPLTRLARVKGVGLEEFLNDEKIEGLIKKCVSRGLEIVTLLGSGSAYFAPSAAIAALVKAIAKDEKRIMGVCANLSGEYGIKDISIGVPCRLGKAGIEKIIELDLGLEEKQKFVKSAEALKQLVKNLPL